MDPLKKYIKSVPPSFELVEQNNKSVGPMKIIKIEQILISVAI